MTPIFQLLILKRNGYGMRIVKMFQYLSTLIQTMRT